MAPKDNISKRQNNILLINSLPKSGTYLVAKFLDEIGAVNSGFHLRQNALWDFKNKDLNQVIANPNQFKADMPLAVSLTKIRAGEFFLAHLECKMWIKNLLLQYNIEHFFLYRKVRDILVSHFRFICNPSLLKLPSWYNKAIPEAELFVIYLEKCGVIYLKSIYSQVEWIKSGVKKIKFEDLMGDNGIYNQSNCLRALVESVGFEFDEKDFLMIFKKKCLSARTRTYSGKRSNAADVWSDQAESIFNSSDGPEIDRILDLAN